eukprot:g6110.t1 g6110   contig20:821200-822666(-)
MNFSKIRHMAFLIAFISTLCRWMSLNNFLSSQSQYYSSSSFFDGNEKINKREGFNSSLFSTNVLIARSVSSSEVSNILADIAKVQSFMNEEVAKEHLKASLSNCKALRDAGYEAKLDPKEFGTEAHPNHVSCLQSPDDNVAAVVARDDNFRTVKADFILFAWNQEVIQNLTIAMTTIKPSTSTNTTKVQIIDVSESPKKIWNWMVYLSNTMLSGYDYVWMMDGDISIASLNWQSFWELVKLVKPKVSQATLVGTESGAYRSAHPKLRPVLDSRIIAAETPIIEVGSPLFEVNTWLGYRDVVLKHTEVLPDVRLGGEHCFDLSWCHYARATLKGHQDCGNIEAIQYNDKYPTVSHNIASVTVSEVTEPSCVVFYQTPMVHLNKQSLNKKADDFGNAQKNTCTFWRETFNVQWCVQTVHEVFVAALP